jgi:tRNA-2-methylthio-N6-dimethylallyladenosine synthase
MADDVSEAEKTSRIVELQALQKDIQTRLNESAVGTEVEVLVDSVSRRRAGELSGRTSGNAVVNVALPAGAPDAGWLGRIARVVIRRAGPHSLSGDLVVDGNGGVGHAH